MTFEEWFALHTDRLEAERDPSASPDGASIYHATKDAWRAAEAEAYGTRNLSMIAKIQAGECVDLRHHVRLGPFWMLEQFQEEKDYAVTYRQELDAREADWIWSIGQVINDPVIFDHEGDEIVLPIGTIVASTSSVLYQNPSFTCLFLR